MPDATPTIGQQLARIAAFIAVIWAVFLLSIPVPSIDHYGVTPRTLTGLLGIATMPFLHANLAHIVANTVPLFVLLCLLAGSRPRPWTIVIDIVLLGGLLLWLFGRTATHIGASGLIFGLIAFLLVSGFLERRFLSLLVAIAVGFIYGSTLLSGVWPSLGSSISWDGHLSSALAGALVAYSLTRPSVERTPTALLESASDRE